MRGPRPPAVQRMPWSRSRGGSVGCGLCGGGLLGRGECSRGSRCCCDAAAVQPRACRATHGAVWRVWLLWIRIEPLFFCFARCCCFGQLHATLSRALRSPEMPTSTQVDVALNGAACCAGPVPRPCNACLGVDRAVAVSVAGCVVVCLNWSRRVLTGIEMLLRRGGGAATSVPSYTWCCVACLAVVDPQ